MAKDAEERIARGVLKIAAANQKGVATFSACRAQIPSLVALTSDDLAPSSTRLGEPMWHQIVRNIKSHDSEDSNYIAQGYLEHVPKVGYKITPSGLLHVKKIP